MHTTSVMSLSWREGGPDLLASCTVPLEERPEILSQLATELHADEVLYLVTCNRVEIAFRSQEPLGTDDARRALISTLDPDGDIQPRAWRAWNGEGAVEHLFLVASGLASAKVGETEIAGQLRDALALSRDLGLCGGPLGDFIDEALRTARKVRQETALNEGRTSLAEIALDQLREHREGHEGPYRVGLLGRSAMTERCARSMSDEEGQLHWINRTPEKVEAIAAELGAEVHSLEDFRAKPVHIDALVTATGSNEPVLGEETIALLADSGLTLVIDLSVSPDVRSSDAEAAGITHFGLQDILVQADLTRSEKSTAAAEARVLVDEALDQLSSRHRARSAGQAASKLHERFRAAASDAAEESLARELKHLSDEDAEKLRRFADLLARRLAHDPAKGLRRLAADHGPGAAEHFLDAQRPKEQPQ